MAKPKQSVTDRQQFWLDHIKTADASAGSLVAYAAAHELQVRDLYQWKTRLNRCGLLPGKARRSSFVPVTTASATAPTTCSITLPNGVRLQFAGNLDATTLGQLLSAASALS